MPVATIFHSTTTPTAVGPFNTASNLHSDDVSIKLQKLANKASIWRSQVPTEKKILYLETIYGNIKKIGPKGFEDMLGVESAIMKGLPDNSKEREIVLSEESLLMATFSKYVVGLLEAFKVRAGQSDHTQEHMRYKDQRRMVEGGQVVVQTFPLLDEDKNGPLGDFKGEVWIRKDKAKKPEDVEAFQFDTVEDHDAATGVHCILGAGNYTGLTVADVLHGLFVRNRVVFVKYHPLRPFLDKFMKVVFEPLFMDGFLDGEVDVSLERTQSIVYSNFVTSVHMTGGKKTHDAIVWGPTPAEQEANKAAGVPILKAEMTSELGAATPYIMTDAVYTDEELVHQAKTVISAKWCNGSASCNAPQVVVMSKQWNQREQFIQHLEEAWKEAVPISTYYPGAMHRWNGFKDQYPTSSKYVNSHKQNNGEIIESHLPLLFVNIDVDLSTTEGKAKAKAEYAFKNEAFCPVLVLATVTDKDFMSKAVELSNDCCFGSLSCSMAVPSSVDGSPETEKAIADLKYGAIALNTWSGQSYVTFSNTWGGFYGETLDSVESGIGNVCNSMLIADAEKSVIRTPCVHPFHFDFVKPADDIIGYNRFVANFLLGVVEPPAEEKRG